MEEGEEENYRTNVLNFAMERRRQKGRGEKEERGRAGARFFSPFASADAEPTDRRRKTFLFVSSPSHKNHEVASSLPSSLSLSRLQGSHQPAIDYLPFQVKRASALGQASGCKSGFSWPGYLYFSGWLNMARTKTSSDVRLRGQVASAAGMKPSTPPE